MAYISKELIIKSYMTLSTLTEDHMQGQTQIVSAIRYLCALDMFFKKEKRECKLKNAEDRNSFVENVRSIVNIRGNYYTANFYSDIKELADCGVGSNFTSSGVVAKSKANTSKEFDYPTRANKPLFIVRDSALYRNVDYYKNIGQYLTTEELKAAFVIWLLRNNNFNDFSFEGVKDELQRIFTSELLEKMMPQKDVLVEFIEDAEQTETKFELKETDLRSLFKSQGVIPQNNKYYSYITALRTKPFLLLAGISGTGKSRIVRKLAQATTTKELEGCEEDELTQIRWTLHRPQNFELIQVKPNWHTSMDVLGYLTSIPEPHYVFSTFVEFVVRAWQHSNVPFFLCLDEMNLAPVEEYFAEYLSAVESRSFEKGEYITDPIIKPFRAFGEDVCDKMIDHLFPNYKASESSKSTPTNTLIAQLKERGLTLPKNLMVIGTVNMDETTFSFSRKVLDRAMSIEMNEVDYDSFLDDSTDDGLEAFIENFKDGQLNRLLVDRHIAAKEFATPDDDDAQFVIGYLKRINALLESTPFKLGYRAANEALILLQAYKDFGINCREDAMDEFTLMKVLSRIEGDETKLRITDSDTDRRRLQEAQVIYENTTMTLLDGLRIIIVDTLGEYSTKEIVEAAGNSEDSEAEEDNEGTEAMTSVVMSEQRNCIKKLDAMITLLARDHFVSYWN